MMYHHRARHNGTIDYPQPHEVTGLTSHFIAVIAANKLYIDGGEVSTWNGIGEGIQGYSQDGDIADLPGKRVYIFSTRSF